MKKTIIFTIFAASLLMATGCADNSNNEINVIDTSVSGPSTEVVDIGAQTPSEIVPEMLTSYSSTGVIYYNGNPWDYNKSASCNVVFGTVTSSNSGDNRVITIPIVLEMTGEYTSDCIDYSSCITPSFELCDSNTGIILPAQRGKGNSGYAYGGAIMNGDQTVNINYSCDYQSEKSDWVPSSTGQDGTYERKITFNIVYTVQVPQGYNGLALKVTPVDAYSPGLEASSGETHFITDEYPEGTRVFAIN